jgi:hypothetical protein
VTAIDLHLGHDDSRRRVEAHRRYRLDHADHAGLDQHGGDAHGAVPAHRQASGHFDVEHAAVGVGASRRLEYRAAHGRVPARLGHEQPADAV